LEAATQLGMR